MKKAEIERLAAEGAAKIREALAKATPAKNDTPERPARFDGSHNCLANVQRDYESRTGGHWFEPSTMRFFGTRFPGGFLDVRTAAGGVTLFVTTEKPPHGERAACVRAYVWQSADIVTCGEVASIPTAGAAERVRNAIADALAADPGEAA